MARHDMTHYDVELPFHLCLDYSRRLASQRQSFFRLIINVTTAPVNLWNVGPIIDPQEFRERFIPTFQRREQEERQHLSSPVSRRNPFAPLVTDELGLMASVLVTWAASYGIDEYGREDADGGFAIGNRNGSASDEAAHPNSGELGGGPSEFARLNNERKKRRRERVTKMVKEILEGVDRLALLRRPTWDGVRVLMLLMPLTEGEHIICLGLIVRGPRAQDNFAEIFLPSSESRLS